MVITLCFCGNIENRKKKFCKLDTYASESACNMLMLHFCLLPFSTLEQLLPAFEMKTYKLPHFLFTNNWCLSPGNQ